MDMKHGRVGSILSEQSVVNGDPTMQSDDGVEYRVEFDDEVVVENDSFRWGADR